MEEHLIEQGTALPQHEKVGLDADEIGDLGEQAAGRLARVQREAARERVAAAAEGELDRGRVVRRGRGAAEAAAGHVGEGQ